MAQPVGLYFSVPFCRAKCTFCNFASQAFPPERMQAYVDRLLREIHEAHTFAVANDLDLADAANTVFLGGGTPSLLSPRQMESIFTALRSEFAIAPEAEITLEAAPGQIADDLLETLLRCGVNRISLGVQSFINRESRAVGRLHTAQQCLAELQRLQNAGVCERNIDLIAGLPHQTAESWQESLGLATSSGAQHISVYMLEIDGDSRLGSEVQSNRAQSQLAVVGQQARYSAAAVPEDDACADLYRQACEFLEVQGLAQYEISNFARAGHSSRHNRKYWDRKPYLGFGLDAHSMLFPAQASPVCRAVRFANVDDLDDYLSGETIPELENIDALAAFEETVFLGLRLVEGISLAELRCQHAASLVDSLIYKAGELASDGLMTRTEGRLCLTPKGRVLSSSVFGELLAVAA